MRRRLYFLVPNIERAREVFHALLLDRVEERHIHFLAREGVELGELPEATLLQKSDAVHGVALGLFVGGFTGAVAGAVVMLFPPEGLAMGLGAVLVLSLIGAVFGSWAASMIAVSVPNTHLRRFDKDLQHGKILMLLDIEKERMDAITHAVERHKAVVRGRDPTIPAFP